LLLEFWCFAAEDQRDTLATVGWLLTEIATQSKAQGSADLVHSQGRQLRDTLP
jgi:hypothetical protein